MGGMHLKGKKGVILGVANDKSIAYGCAKICHELGAELALTYLNEKAKPYVEPLATRLQVPIFLPVDVQKPKEIDTLFETISKTWGKLDFLIHAMAYAPMEDLQGPVHQASLAGFTWAMDVSCHSFLRLAKAALPLMKEGGSLLTFSFLGAQKVCTNYNLMGPTKAALEACVKYLAVELGPKNIRVNALSPGFIRTRAATGIKDIDDLIEEATKHTPFPRMPNINDVGQAAAFLISDWAEMINGVILPVDGGWSVMS